MEQSIEELQRLVELAEDRFREASDARTLARANLHEAQKAASGIIGHVLEFRVYQGYGRTAKHVTKRLLVDDVRPVGWKGEKQRAYGKAVVAGNKLGVRRLDVIVTDATDLGRFEKAAS